MQTTAFIGGIRWCSCCGAFLHRAALLLLPQQRLLSTCDSFKQLEKHFIPSS
jgi:hypothetical protein